MHCFFYFINSLFYLMLLDYAFSSPIENYNNITIEEDGTNYTDNGIRMSRQVNKYDNAVILTVGTALCTNQLLKTQSSSSEENSKMCTIDVRKLKSRHALLVDALNHELFVYPDDNGIITFFHKEPIFLSCPGQDNNLRNVPGKPQHATFLCECGEIFEKDKAFYDFKILDCEATPKYTISNQGKFGDAFKYQNFIVGFQTDETSFLKLIDINYDTWYMVTVSVKSMISKSIAGSQKSSKNLRFDPTYYCEQPGVILDEIYKLPEQKSSFARQLKCQSSTSNACNYIDPSKGYIFNRGHLSPKSTFVYTSSGQATFVYLNSAPQWQAVNEGNWVYIEQHVIEMVKYFKKDSLYRCLGVLKVKGLCRRQQRRIYDTLRFGKWGESIANTVIFLESCLRSTHQQGRDVRYRE